MDLGPADSREGPGTYPVSEVKNSKDNETCSPCGTGVCFGLGFVVRGYIYRHTG